MNKIRVIICEDHSLFREGIKSYLNAREDIECVGEAENGAQLLYLLRHRFTENTPDVVLLDINMPIMGGEEALQRLKEEHPNIKVIMLTMHNEVSMVERMMSLGANSYVTKTDAADQIVKAILSVHNNDYYFNDLINQALVRSVRRTRHIEDHGEVERVIEVEYESNEKSKFGWAKKTFTAAGYGILAALIISVIVYVIIRISSNLSVIGQPSY